MINDKLINFLSASLKESKVIRDRFKIDLSEAEKCIVAKNFQNEILTFLDYIYTNFPVNREYLGNYFPRPSLSESKLDYSNRIKKFFKKRKEGEHPNQIIDFLQYFYDLNEQNKFAISYIQSCVKHETPNQFNKELAMNVKAKFTSNHPAPIQQFSDGSLEVAGFGRFIDCDNITIINSITCDVNYFTNIEKFELKKVKMTGDKIVFINAIEFLFIEWADNCIIICEQLFEDFKQK